MVTQATTEFCQWYTILSTQHISFLILLFLLYTLLAFSLSWCFYSNYSLFQSGFCSAFIPFLPIKNWPLPRVTTGAVLEVIISLIDRDADPRKGLVSVAPRGGVGKYSWVKIPFFFLLWWTGKINKRVLNRRIREKATLSNAQENRTEGRTWNQSGDLAHQSELIQINGNKQN